MERPRLVLEIDLDAAPARFCPTDGTGLETNLDSNAAGVGKRFLGDAGTSQKEVRYCTLQSISAPYYGWDLERSHAGALFLYEPMVAAGL